MALFDLKNEKRFCFVLPAPMLQEIRAAARAANVTASAVVREAVNRGLPLARDALRKQRRQLARQTERQGVNQ